MLEAFQPFMDAWDAYAKRNRAEAILAYSRLHLNGLIKTSDNPTDAEIIARLKAALDYERRLAAEQHWSYDYPRHFRLSIAHAAETGTN